MQDNKYIVDVVIPTYKPDERIWKLLERLDKQTYVINKTIIINTDESCIDTVRIAAMKNVEIHHIDLEEFDHGTSRNYGITFSNADIIVFMTQDAIPDNKYMIEELVKPFKDEDVYVTYGRQLPMQNCAFIEAYTRQFNYPETDIVKTKESIKSMGIKTYFSSDVCAAYRREKQIELGGFPRTIFNEDSIFAAQVINNDKKVYYVSKARVLHSHNYTYMQQFRRNFDIGVSHKDFEEVFGMVKSEDEGIKLVKQTVKYLISMGKWYLIPDMLIRSGFKFIGYRMGKQYRRLSRRMVLWCTSTKQYWRY